MNPIRKVAQFNNQLAWWWIGLMPERLCDDPQWVRSSGTRFASFLVGLNIINCLLLFEKITNISVSKLMAGLLVGLAIVIVQTVAIRHEIYDFNAIKNLSTKQQYDLKIGSTVYTAATLIILISIV